MNQIGTITEKSPKCLLIFEFDKKAKNALRKLGAISKLVTLLDNPCPEVQRAAMKAIKNIIYTNDAAKMDMRRCGGLESVLRYLTLICFGCFICPMVIFSAYNSSSMNTIDLKLVFSKFLQSVLVIR